MEGLKLGFDLDGVVTKESNAYNLATRFKIPWIVVQIGSLFSRRFLKPSEEDIIITGRSVKDKWCTELWCRIHRIKPKKIYYNYIDSLDKEDIALYKREVIDLEEIDIYIEDDKEIAKRIGYSVIPFEVKGKKLYCIFRK